MAGFRRRAKKKACGKGRDDEMLNSVRKSDLTNLLCQCLAAGLEFQEQEMLQKTLLYSY